MSSYVLSALRLSFFLLAGSLLVSCSFHSNQVDYLKALLNSPKEANVSAQWRMLWRSQQIDLYLIEQNGQFIFTNGRELAIWFDGWRVKRIIGLPGGPNTIAIMYSKDTELADSRSHNKASTSSVASAQPVKERDAVYRSSVMTQSPSCNAWSSEVREGSINFSQTCVLNKDTTTFNRVILDGVGMIVQIETKVLISYQSDRMERLVINKI